MMTDEEKREALYAQLMEKMKRQERFMPAASEALANQGFGAAMAKAAAQAGTLGGKMADTSAVDDSQAALRNNINMVGQDTSGADLKQKLYSDLGSKIQARNAAMQSSQDKAEKMAFDNKRLDADIGLKNAMLAQKNEPSYTSTGKTDEAGNLILLSKSGETKLGPKIPAKSQEQTHADKKSSQETLYRYNALQTNAEKLKALIKQHGTMELLGPTGTQMDSAIYQMAVDFAKMVDPDSVAREGEVASAKKYMLPVRDWGGAGVTNDTALKLIDDYKKDLDARLAARNASKNNESYVGEPNIGQAPGSAYAAPKQVYKDGETKSVGGKTYIRQGGVWRAN